MNTPRKIIEGQGVEEVAAALGVDRARVMRARLDDKLPASWFARLSAMYGMDLDRSLFSFKGMDQ